MSTKEVKIDPNLVLGITVGQANQIASYLASKPFIEVADLIRMLQSLMPVNTASPTPDPAKLKLAKKTKEEPKAV